MRRVRVLRSFLCVFAAAVSLCTLPPGEKNARSEPGPGKAEAVRIATAFLRQQSFGRDYILDAPTVTRTNDAKKNWLFVFKHVNWQTERPGRGIVMVDRTTGLPRWVPAR